MAKYKVEVTTGNMKYAGTMDHISITLFGSEGQSGRTELNNFGINLKTGTTRIYTIKNKLSLGKILLLKVEKERFLFFPEDEWYCSKIVVTTPEGDVILFPCYQWISRGELVELRGGRGVKVFEEDYPLLIEHREQELRLKKSLYQWEISDKKLPHKSHFKHISEIPAEIRFSMSKTEEMVYSARTIGIELLFKGLIGSTENWEDFEDMKKIFQSKKTALSEYVSEHWKEDDFFGFQFLNSTNPNVIKRCSELPSNFPVTEEMVKTFLEEGSSLKEEMQKGNIFIRDQKIMDGIPSRICDGESLPFTAGLCLFYMNTDNKLMPIAIQLQQQPSVQNPIFLPSDSETDWLLAKLFIKSTDLMEYEAVHHLLNTHLLGEVFTVATLRCFPVIHPLYKLLMPHFRYILHVNSLARRDLLGPKGALSKSSLGIDGLMELMRRSLSEMTYSSLCLPENITARGLESVPNFYYRDDGLKLWRIIYRFVKDMVDHYYLSDSDVCRDTELQEWISEIFIHGVLANKHSGFPESLNNTEELTNFLTMVIFTVSAQHAAVNNGQFDYHSWTPNGSLLLHKPPPTSKGESTMKTIFETLPNVGETASFAGVAWLLSDTYTDVVFLGQYPEERFNEPAPKQIIQKFQVELSSLSEEITKRNSLLEVPYTYLDPKQIENSTSI